MSWKYKIQYLSDITWDRICFPTYTKKLRCKALDMHAAVVDKISFLCVWQECFVFLLCQQAEEVQLLRDSLRSLRNNFRDHDPQHHTLDTLEQGIVSLIDRLHVLHTHRVQTHADSNFKIFFYSVVNWLVSSNERLCYKMDLYCCFRDLKSWRAFYPNTAGKGEISKTQRPTHRLWHLALHK